MTTKFQSKFAQMMIVGIFGILIFSFALSGFQQDVTFISDSGPTVAKVGQANITVREYGSALNQQVEMYSRMMGGQPLTSKQIEQFGVKQMVLKRLIDKKIMQNLAMDLGLNASEQELAAEIKKLPYFQTNGEFDVQKYKALLAQNQFTPQMFESNVSEDMLVQKIDGILDTLKLSSKNYAKDFTKFKNTQTTLHTIEFSKEALREKISIANSEVDTYLKKEENVKMLQSIFEGQKFKFNKPEQVKAKHILLRADANNEASVKKEIEKIKAGLTTANFAKIAKDKSQDGSASKGGDLGWFGKGQMVKEFEEVAFNSAKGTISNPVKTQFGYHIIYVEDKKQAENKTFNDVKKELAIEQIRKDKNAELDKLFDDTIKKSQSLLEQNKIAELEKFSNELNLTFSKDIKINKIEKRAGRVSFNDEELKQVFDSANNRKIVNLGTAIKARLVKIGNTTVEKSDDKMITDNLNMQNDKINNQLREAMIKDLEAKYSIKTYNNKL